MLEIQIVHINTIIIKNLLIINKFHIYKNKNIKRKRKIPYFFEYFLHVRLFSDY